jgi:AraC family transcriptional regulator, regulatory protein of adaptative response / DNA-3-methyladenine glycosylase II
MRPRPGESTRPMVDPTGLAPLDSAQALPPLEACHRARESRDARFDGLFFTAVRSTRVYCRSICPAPTCKRENVVYYPSAAAAQAAGYRPCLRCRPELAPGPNVDDDAALRRALSLITAGYLADASVEALAVEVGLSARHLRRRFVARLGATPLTVHATQRLLSAKQLLTDTDWPIAQVAAAAGFSSVRRFNAAFQQACRLAPRDLRRCALPLSELATTLRLPYRPPFDFAATLVHLRREAVPGVESVEDGAYRRAFGAANRCRWLHVSTVPGRSELKLEVFGSVPEEIPALVQRVRRQFDLDADCEAMRSALSGDARLLADLTARPGLRLPGAWDGFELTVAELLVAATGRAAARDALLLVVGTHGEVHPGAPPGLGFVFPKPERLAVVELEGLGIDALAATRIRSLSVAVRDGGLHFRVGQEREAFVRRLSALTQLPAERAQWIALRVLGDPDACPLPDAGAESAARWRPWRAYGCLYASAAPRFIGEAIDA